MKIFVARAYNPFSAHVSVGVGVTEETAREALEAEILEDESIIRDGDLTEEHLANWDRDFKVVVREV